MKIYKVKSTERKGDQHWEMVCNCRDYWKSLNNAKYTYYPDAMNIKTVKWSKKHNCSVVLTNHLKLNKW